MLLMTCGYKVEDENIALLKQFVEERKATKIDVSTLIAVLT